MRWTLLDAVVFRIESHRHELDRPTATVTTSFMASDPVTLDLEQRIDLARLVTLSILSSLLSHPDHSEVRFEYQVAAILPNNPTK